MWLIIGLTVGAVLLALILSVRSRNIAVKWYDWLVGGSGLGLLLFTIQNFTASFAEHEEAAARNFLRLFGTPAVILLTIFFLLIWYRWRAITHSSRDKAPEL